VTAVIPVMAVAATLAEVQAHARKIDAVAVPVTTAPVTVAAAVAAVTVAITAVVDLRDTLLGACRRLE
jgi:hypothetical protein